MHTRKVCEGLNIVAGSQLHLHAEHRLAVLVVWMARFKAASEGPKFKAPTGAPTTMAVPQTTIPIPHPPKIFHQLPSVTSCNGILSSGPFSLAPPRFTSQDGAALNSPPTPPHQSLYQPMYEPNSWPMRMTFHGTQPMLHRSVPVVWAPCRAR